MSIKKHPFNEKKFIDDLIKKADDLIALNSRKKNGPCLSGIFEPITGDTFYAQNFLKNEIGKAEYLKFVDEAHPVIKKRIKAQQKLIDEGKLPADIDIRAGGHSEIRALDEALKARDKVTGRISTEADLKDLYLHNRHLPSNTPFNRCPNCSSITSGVQTVGGHN